ncbi:secretin N-terminal domain-containing protein [Neorhodopirellula pilleata]|uniref:secretin N-terminal domain-containing protein n=1 Tax=Neorhodopirellula pilleata TaxID=2714738 RepID=UPI0028F41757|nr:secretin N-terminal domain-containing protein [Neorhodopirellula pilleata]
MSKRVTSVQTCSLVVWVSLLAANFATTGLADGSKRPELRQIAVPVEWVESVATRLNLQYQNEVGVSIAADDRGGGAILVMAPPDLHSQIAREAAVLTQRMANTADQMEATTATVHLINITWREAESALKTIAGGNVPFTISRNGEVSSLQIRLSGSATPPAQFEVDRRTNQIKITADGGTQASWQEVLRAIDRPVRFIGEQTYIHKLVHADVAPVQRAVRLLRRLEPAESPTRRNDRPAANRSAGVFRTAAFQNEAAGDATPSADVEAADTDDSDDGGVIGDTDIQIVPDSGLIIIKGAKKDVERIKKVIAEIEEQAKITQPDVEIRQLEYADSNAVATLLSQLYEDVLSARQGEVSITSLDAPNALLLIGRAEAIKAVMELVDKIDQPVPESDRLRVFRLKHASATDAETVIREFFTSQPGGDEDPRPGLGTRVRISADYRTNSLIIGASPRDMTEVTRLIEELDVQKIESSSQIKVFPLRNARAEDLAPIMQEAITGQAEDQPDDTTTPSATLSIVNLGPGGSPILNSGVLAGALVTADNNANALIVRAPAEGMPLIAELIRQLDQSPGIDSLVKVFTVENGDATQLTTALQNLFGDEAGTSGTSIGAGNQAGLPPLSAAPSALVPLRFSTDIRTNSIIASGSAEDLEVVESILMRLDSTGFAERITEVIWLKHQIATNIATAVQDYVSQRQQFQNIIPQFQQGLGPLDLPDRDIIVVPEAQTNSLLISVSPRLYEEVRRLIDRLDRRPPMVLIKTLIAEISLEDGFEIGGEFGLQDSVLFDRGIAVAPTTVPNTPGSTADAVTIVPSVPGFNFNGLNTPNNNSVGREDVGSRGVTSFGAAASQISQLGSGGFVFSAASESVNLFLRTLQTANRLQILSRPEIMTADNTQGFVQVGQNFPRPTNIQVTQNGQTLIGIEDVDIGIILQVTPRVGADGLILMAIDASRSAVNFTTGQNIGFDNNNNPIFVPAIDTTTAQATVTAFDGQTVVFGGLITKRRSNFSRRVPYLADIPLLGTFFKYEGETETRTELLVIMTPVLVTGHEDLEYVKQIESSRMSWCLADVVEAHGDVGLSGGYGLWGPAIGPTIYPDVHPTVDVFPAADLPKSAAYRHAPIMETYPAGAAPMGIELSPGESIIQHSEMLDSNPIPSPQPMNSPPAGVINEVPYGVPETLPPPVVDTLPTPQASTKKWSQFNARLSSFKK